MGHGDTVMLNAPNNETGKSAGTRVSGMATNAEHSASVISIKTWTAKFKIQNFDKN